MAEEIIFTVNDTQEQVSLFVDDNLGEANTINTVLETGMTGEDLVLNVLSLTQAEYNAGTPIATTFYIITDA